MASSTPSSEWVVNTDDPLFEADVFERSKVTLVILDFWAPMKQNKACEK
jgi:thioredoxin-like negative regulator of GroEL